MFKPDDILVLSKAGFTAQQIAGLSMLANQPAPAPATPVAPAVPNPVTVQNPAPAPATPVVPQPVVNPAPVPQPVDPVLTELQKLTGLMQMQNINSINQPPKAETPEDILASIINPPIKKE